MDRIGDHACRHSRSMSIDRHRCCKTPTAEGPGRGPSRRPGTPRPSRGPPACVWAWRPGGVRSGGEAGQAECEREKEEEEEEAVGAGRQAGKQTHVRSAWETKVPVARKCCSARVRTIVSITSEIQPGGGGGAEDR